MHVDRMPDRPELLIFFEAALNAQVGSYAESDGLGECKACDQ